MASATNAALARAGEVIARGCADVGEDRRELRWIGQEDDAERALFRRHAEAGSVHAQDAGLAQQRQDVVLVGAARRQRHRGMA